MPGKEYSDCGIEFADMERTGNQSEDEQSRDGHKKKTSNKRLHERLLRNMSYMVVSAIAVISISQTVDVDSIQQNVIAAGGNVEGDVRFTIQWNDRDSNPNDFDAHCVEPGGYEIYYGNRETVSPDGGTLDVDITYPLEEVAIENIVYSSKNDMEEGTYQFYVHCFAHNGGTSGFRGQIEIRGSVYNFEYNKELAPGEIVVVAEVTLEDGTATFEVKATLENGKFTLDKKLNK